MDINRGEAKNLIDSYYDRFHGKSWMARVVEEAQEKGYVTTMLGRRRSARDINSRNAMARKAAERLAINSPVQGTAADLIKLAMIQVQNYLNAEACQSKLLYRFTMN